MKLGFTLGVESLSSSKRKLLLILPPLVVIVLIASFFVLPDIQERQVLSDQLERQRNDITAARQRSEKLPALIAENERLKSKLSELQLQLPEEREVSGLLRQVSVLGTNAGLRVVLWKPKEKGIHASKDVYEIPVEVAMRGNYHRFGELFSNIATLNRIVNITNFTMKGPAQITPKNMGLLNVGFTAVTYSIISEQARKDLEKKADMEKKK